MKSLLTLATETLGQMLDAVRVENVVQADQVAQYVQGMPQHLITGVGLKVFGSWKELKTKENWTWLHLYFVFRCFHLSFKDVQLDIRNKYLEAYTLFAKHPEELANVRKICVHDWDPDLVSFVCQHLSHVTQLEIFYEQVEYRKYDQEKKSQEQIFSSLKLVSHAILNCDRHTFYDFMSAQSNNPCLVDLEYHDYFKLTPHTYSTAFDLDFLYNDDIQIKKFTRSCIFEILSLCEEEYCREEYANSKSQLEVLVLIHDYDPNAYVDFKLERDRSDLLQNFFEEVPKAFPKLRELDLDLFCAMENLRELPKILWSCLTAVQINIHEKQFCSVLSAMQKETPLLKSLTLYYVYERFVNTVGRKPEEVQAVVNMQHLKELYLGIPQCSLNLVKGVLQQMPNLRDLHLNPNYIADYSRQALISCFEPPPSHLHSLGFHFKWIEGRDGNECRKCKEIIAEKCEGVVKNVKVKFGEKWDDD